jgi:hypothetical protein
MTLGPSGALVSFRRWACGSTLWETFEEYFEFNHRLRAVVVVCLPLVNPAIAPTLHRAKRLSRSKVVISLEMPRFSRNRADWWELQVWLGLLLGRREMKRLIAHLPVGGIEEGEAIE